MRAEGERRKSKANGGGGETNGKQAGACAPQASEDEARRRAGGDRLVRGADGGKGRTGRAIQLARDSNRGEAIEGDQLGVS